MASIMEMAGDKMKDNGINADSLSKIMNEMQKLIIDSLTKSFNINPGTLDSLKNLLK